MARRRARTLLESGHRLFFRRSPPALRIVSPCCNNNNNQPARPPFVIPFLFFSPARRRPACPPRSSRLAKPSFFCDEPPRSGSLRPARAFLCCTLTRNNNTKPRALRRPLPAPASPMRRRAHAWPLPPSLAPKHTTTPLLALSILRCPPRVLTQAVPRPDTRRACPAPPSPPHSALIFALAPAQLSCTHPPNSLTRPTLTATLAAATLAGPEPSLHSRSQYTRSRLQHAD